MRRRGLSEPLLVVLDGNRGVRMKDGIVARLKERAADPDSSCRDADLAKLAA